MGRKAAPKAVILRRAQNLGRCVLAFTSAAANRGSFVPKALHLMKRHSGRSSESRSLPLGLHALSRKIPVRLFPGLTTSQSAESAIYTSLGRRPRLAAHEVPGALKARHKNLPHRPKLEPSPRHFLHDPQNAVRSSQGPSPPEASF